MTMLGCEPIIKSYAYALGAVSSPDLDRLMGIKRQLQFRSKQSDECSRDSGYDSSGKDSCRRESSASLSSRRSSPECTVAESYCKWKDCRDTVMEENALYSHIIDTHLKPILQAHESAERASRPRSSRTPLARSCRGKLPSFACAWHGCKAYGVERSYGALHRRYEYLRSHLLSMHCGNKPYACLLNDCKMRFCSQQALKGHMDGHANRASRQVSADNKCNNSNNNNHNEQIELNSKRRRVHIQRPPTPPPVGNSLDRRTSEKMCDELARVRCGHAQKESDKTNRHKINGRLLEAVKGVVAHLRKEKLDYEAIQMLKLQTHGTTIISSDV